MPYIRVIFPVREKEVASILRNAENKLAIRQALSQLFPKYPVEQIAIIPEPLSDEAMEFADNLLPLELKIDIGRHSAQLNENHSDRLCDWLTALCPALEKIHFGIWLREFSSNGFTEHKP